MDKEKGATLKAGKTLLTAYLQNSIVGDLPSVPFNMKLTIINQMAGKHVKYREVGKKQVPYLDHHFAKKAANFLCNFDVSADILRSEYSVYKAEVTKWTNGKPDGKKTVDCYESVRDVKFTYTNGITGKECWRTVTGTAKAFENPATTRHDVEKMALSNAWSLLLQTFGINPSELETTAYKEAEEEAINEAPETPAVERTFNY